MSMPPNSKTPQEILAAQESYVKGVLRLLTEVRDGLAGLGLRPQPALIKAGQLLSEERDALVFRPDDFSADAPTQLRPAA